MSEVNIKAITEERWELVKDLAAGLNNDRLLVRVVRNIEVGQIRDIVEDLRLRTDEKNPENQPKSYVDDPMASRSKREKGKVYKGRWRNVRVEGYARGENKRDGIVVQILAEGWLTKITKGTNMIWSEARLVSGRDFPAGVNTTVAHPGGDDEGEWLTVRWTGIDPQALPAIRTAIAALSTGGFNVVIYGKSYGSGFHRIGMDTLIGRDGSASVTLLLSKPEFTLEAFTSYLTGRHSDVVHLWGVPLELAQPIIDNHKREGNSASVRYRERVVDITLYTPRFLGASIDDGLFQHSGDFDEQNGHFWGVRLIDAQGMYTVPPAPRTTLSADVVGASDITFDLASSDFSKVDLLLGSRDDEEIMQITEINHSTNVATVIRGYLGTVISDKPSGQKLFAIGLSADSATTLSAAVVGDDDDTFELADADFLNENDIILASADGEQMLVRSIDRSTNIATVTRGFNSTTKSDKSNGDTIRSISKYTAPIGQGTTLAGAITSDAQTSVNLNDITFIEAGDFLLTRGDGEQMFVSAVAPGSPPSVTVIRGYMGTPISDKAVGTAIKILPTRGMTWTKRISPGANDRYDVLLIAHIRNYRAFDLPIQTDFDSAPPDLSEMNAIRNAPLATLFESIQRGVIGDSNILDLDTAIQSYIKTQEVRIRDDNSKDVVTRVRQSIDDLEVITWDARYGTAQLVVFVNKNDAEWAAVKATYLTPLAAVDARISTSLHFNEDGTFSGSITSIPDPNISSLVALPENEYQYATINQLRKLVCRRISSKYFAPLSGTSARDYMEVSNAPGAGMRRVKGDTWQATKVIDSLIPSSEAYPYSSTCPTVG